MRALFLTLLFVATVLIVPDRANADHNTQRHWRVENPLPQRIELHEYVGSNWTPYLDASVFDWDESSVLVPEKFNFDYVHHGSQNCDNTPMVSDRIQVCHYRKSNNVCGAALWTTIQGPSNHFDAVKVKLNSEYLNDPDACGSPQETTCHELGHAVGLGHSSSPNSCVEGSFDDVADEHLGVHDDEALDSQGVYGHRH